MTPAPITKATRTPATSFRSSAVGFVLMTTLVVLAATGVFILLDPRSAAFWATKYGDLAALVRGVLGR